MNRPLLLGHRGARATRHVPENTLPSFELCLQHGCDGFEFDVRQSADGQAVICHDATWQGMKISEHAAHDLGLPRLEDVLQHFSSRAFLDIELKVPGLEEQTQAALHKFPPKNGYVVSSFLPSVLSALPALDSGIPLGWLCETRDQFPLLRPGQAGMHRDPGVTWVIPRVNLVTRELVEELHAAGEKIMVWTVNRAADMRCLAEWSVDGLISDQTELLVQTAGQKR